MALLHRFFILITLCVLANSAIANNAPAVKKSQKQLKHHNIAAYMGTRVDLLPQELAAQLPEDVLVGQGIMVSGFTKDSPAEKAGLKTYDILLTYDRHALMHPKKLIDLVRNDQIGREVKLKLVRKGKIIMIPVTLTSQQYDLDEDQLDYQYNMQLKGYDGIQINQLSKNNFKAMIRYLAPDSVVRVRTFTGEYKKVLYDIQMAPDMSKIAKHDLTREITKRKDDEDGWFGKWIPFGDGNFSPDNMKNFGLPK